MNDLSQENLLKQITKQIEQSGLESIEDINEFLKETNMGADLSISESDLSEEDRNAMEADHLVIQAIKEPSAQAEKTIAQALTLDPENIEAHVFLARSAEDIEEAIGHYEDAIEFGDLKFGGEYLKENKGHFWALIETRPYMRALSGLLDCYDVVDDVERAMSVSEQLLELNSNDNQGIRYNMSTLMLRRRQLVKCERFIAKWDEDDSTIFAYNIALCSFMRHGKTAKSRKLLMKAYETNEHVLSYLLLQEDLPKEFPSRYAMGSKDEAAMYILSALPVWSANKKALLWVAEFKAAIDKMN